jgi:hypothetical protein
VRIWPNTELSPPSHPPPLNHLVKASYADSSLGGGAPDYNAAARRVLGAEAPPDTVPTAVEGRLSRSLIAGFPSVVSTVVTGQIEFLSSHRSRRKKPHRKWCTIAWAWALSSRWPWRPGALLRPDEAEEGDAPVAVHVWTDSRDWIKRIPLQVFNLSCRSLSRRPSFIEPGDRTREPP